MKHNSNVPAFLTKLWTLVEDSDTNEFICWSQEGNSFLVLDEQRFAKEILPKFFKHNNMASFVRQLNMYGFRKVMHIDTGIVKQERDGPVEFQHPYFKHGQDDLLENIKRKVSTSRPEENKLKQEDLSKILSSVQNVHGKQESLDSRLATLKRENEALWREMSDLRQKHANQQQVIKELVQFIFTLVQNNRIINLKRKSRPLLLNSNGKKSKFIHQIFDEHTDHAKASVNGLSAPKNSAEISEDIIICDMTSEEPEVTVPSSRLMEQMDVEIIEVTDDSTSAAMPPAASLLDEDDLGLGADELPRSPATADAFPSSSSSSSALQQLNKPSALSQEDPLKMMDSILKESGAISQNINLLGKVELMDYLDSIDCSLEDFQAMLYGKQFSIDPDLLEGTDPSKGTIELLSREAKVDDDNADKQLIQYTSCPLLAFLDGCTPLAPSEPKTSVPICASTSSHPPMSALTASSLLETDSLMGVGSSTLPDHEPPADLLAIPSESIDKPRSSTLIRLEPLTEAEANEATLFYMCELNPESLEGHGTTSLEL